MKRFTGLLLAGVLVGAMFVSIPNGNSEESSPVEYMGAESCKKCHNGKVADKGATFSAYDIWAGERHAKAYETLGGEEAKKIAAEKGIEDPQKAEQCLKCHVTGYGMDAAVLGGAEGSKSKYSMEEGVSCESCHGAGGKYVKALKDKKKLAGMEDGEEKDALRASIGLKIPTEETCKACHNEESPNFKGFDFAEYVQKIAHPVYGEKSE
ncbi:MAG: hypothetical protein D6675_04230 [Gemmatimonadetes bacterium]|nr:MAG: hypothetical protein D6675_04230 [Gemmatimonadota bacterium]